jgi:hypothetical protein
VTFARRRDRQPRLSSDRRPQLSEKICERDRDGCRGRGVDHPIGPADHESWELTERTSHEQVRPTCLREHGAHLGRRVGGDELVHGDENPQQRDPRYARETRGHKRGNPEDTHANGTADTDSHAERNTQYSPQVDDMPHRHARNRREGV